MTKPKLSAAKKKEMQRRLDEIAELSRELHDMIQKEIGPEAFIFEESSNLYVLTCGTDDDAPGYEFFEGRKAIVVGTKRPSAISGGAWYD